MGRMPPQARATAATGLLTPFNARMQRANERSRVAAGAAATNPPATSTNE